MKIKFIIFALLFCSCTKNRFSGHVYDYDTEEPIKNVEVNINKNMTLTDTTGYFSLKINSNSSCTIFLNKKGYVSKKLHRKPDSKDESNKRNLKVHNIYLYNKESDFFNKIK